MGTPSNATPVLLNSWKQIAAHLGCSVRTAQRWERQFGLPVHHPSANARGPVLARPHDLDLWVARGRRGRINAGHRDDFSKTRQILESTNENAGRLQKSLQLLTAQVERARKLAARRDGFFPKALTE